jgi:peptide/nickel transport system permease protein
MMRCGTVQSLPMPSPAAVGLLYALLRRLRDLAVVLFCTTAVLFVMLRLSGDPVAVMAGPDATPAQIAEIRSAYGFDRPLPAQFAAYVGRMVHLDLGESLADGEPALAKVLRVFPASLLLGSLAMGLTLLVSIPLGAWLGARPAGGGRAAARGALLLLQGFPGFVTALVLVQLFAIERPWLPALGFRGIDSWILPVTSIAAYLSPKLVRLVEANVVSAMGSGFVRTARAIGASDAQVLWRHVMPNALLGATALIGTQFAFLVTGLVVIETIFAWPGMGWLLVQSTVSLDFPVVQAIVVVTVVTVYAVNAATDALQRLVDPRLRPAATHATESPP